MVSEFFVNVLFNIAVFVLDKTNIGDFSWDISTGSMDTFFEYVRAILYFLPTQTIMIILGLILWFGVFRVCIRLLRTIWDILPFV